MVPESWGSGFPGPCLRLCQTKCIRMFLFIASTDIDMKLIQCNKLFWNTQGFGKEKDGNRTNLCLHSFVFSFERSCFSAARNLAKWHIDLKIKGEFFKINHWVNSLAHGVAKYQIKWKGLVRINYEITLQLVLAKWYI